MAREPRTDEHIRTEISAERERLVDALADLRESIEKKRKLAAVTGALIAGGIAAGTSVKAIRRLRGK
ncbi:MAG TPA: hypothetical protein VFR38_03765 [Gaiellaceae bacterium]|nr:hypothetical protein [Gaiellaceae bacterium]